MIPNMKMSKFVHLYAAFYDCARQIMACNDANLVMKMDHLSTCKCKINVS